MRQKQSGNVLFLILIATALFAGLSFAVTQSGKSGSADGMDRDKARLIASELIQYSTAMEQAISRLMMVNDCAETEISFENPQIFGYINPNAPADKSCHIFDIAGGGLTNKDRYFYGQIGGDPGFYGHGSRSDFQDVGVSGCGDNTCTEMYTLFSMKGSNAPAVCTAINKLHGHDDLIPTPITGYLWYPIKFTGSFTSPATGGNATLRGKTSFCYNYSSDQSQFFYVHVLLAR